MSKNTFYSDFYFYHFYNFFKDNLLLNISCVKRRNYAIVKNIILY